METLEQELKARTMMHKITIVGGALMRNYMITHSKGVQLPPHVIQDQADEYSNKVMQHAFEHGTFEELYNKIWDSLKDIIPDNLNLMGKLENNL